MADATGQFATIRLVRLCANLVMITTVAVETTKRVTRRVTDSLANFNKRPEKVASNKK